MLLIHATGSPPRWSNQEQSGAGEEENEGTTRKHATLHTHAWHDGTNPSYPKKRNGQAGLHLHLAVHLHRPAGELTK